MKNPIFTKEYMILSYKIIKRLGLLEIKPLKKTIDPLEETLHRARIFATKEEYVATALFTTIITLPLAFVLIHFPLVRGLLGIGPGAIILSSVITVAYAIGVIFIFIIYPSYKLDRLRESIENHLPYATAHMATIAGTGVPIFQVFKIIGNFEEYGQVAEECKRLGRNIDVFGYDTLTAISEAAKTTPSSSFKDLLWGMISISRTGGDIRRFLMEKSDEFMERQQTKQEEFIDSLEVLAEVYTTVFVAGPVLVIIMLTVMGTMGGLPFALRSIFSFLIYLILPILSIGFMILVEGSKPAGGM